MNYLQLCQEIVNELGLSGRPTLLDVDGSVAGGGVKITELVNVTRWIRDATLSIDNAWLDWKYHWNRYSQSANANATALPAPAGGILVRQWDKNKFRWRPTGIVGAWQGLDYYGREDLLIQFDPDNAVPAPPCGFTINPDNSVMLSAPLDATYDFLAEFWQRPVALAAKTDIPLMPAEYHRIIVCRASVMYGNREDAPEVISGMEAELIDIEDKMQADQLEGFAFRRSSTDRDRDTRGGHHIGRFLA